MAINYHKNPEKIAQMLRNAHNPHVCTVRKEFFDAEFDFFKKHIQQKNVLVAGSGLGHDSFYIAQYNAFVTGMELIHTFVQEAKDTAKENKLTNIAFIQGDFLHTAYPDKYFDVTILNMGTIGNFDDKEKVIQSLLRISDIFFFGFWTPEEKDVPLRVKMYEEEGGLEIEVDGTTIREKLSGLESNCITKEEIAIIAKKLGAKIKFYPMFRSFIMAEIS